MAAGEGDAVEHHMWFQAETMIRRELGVRESGRWRSDLVHAFSIRTLAASTAGHRQPKGAPLAPVNRAEPAGPRLSDWHGAGFVAVVPDVDAVLVQAATLVSPRKPREPAYHAGPEMARPYLRQHRKAGGQVAAKHPQTCSACPRPSGPPPLRLAARHAP